MNIRTDAAAVPPGPRRGNGALVALALGALVMAVIGYGALAILQGGEGRLRDALLGGLAAAGATALGTLPVLLARRPSQRVYDALLGFGAGVMLAASSFSLVVPALQAARARGADGWGAGATVGAGILLGAALLLLVDRLLPADGAALLAPEADLNPLKAVEAHGDKATHPPLPSDSRQPQQQHQQQDALRRVWLFVLAICMHNIPEGLAIGVAFAGADRLGATALSTGIAIQDIPEGLVVALALRGIGYGRGFSTLAGVLSGIVEPIAAVAGAAVLSLSAGLLPWGLAMAAGAMLYVICNEIIPEAHRRGHGALSTWALLLGFVVMMLLDTALG